MKPGDVIVLTGARLRSMGLLASDLGARRFTVIECSCDLCGTGRFVASADRHFAREAVRVHDEEHWRDEGTAAQTRAEMAGIARGIRKAQRGR